MPIIQCDKAVGNHAITGKTIWYSDNLAYLVKRHCPEIYEIAKEAGFRFLPSKDANELTHKPPHISFDVVRDAPASEPLAAA
jgi:hypothetical protein